MQRAARSDFDYWLLDGEATWACQALHHPPPATSCLGYCHGKCPFSTIRDKWGQTPIKVNSHLHQGHRGPAILIPYTLRVIKTHPEEEGEVDRVFETANEMLICWPARNEVWGTQGHKRRFIHTSVELTFSIMVCVCWGFLVSLFLIKRWTSSEAPSKLQII